MRANRLGAGLRANRMSLSARRSIRFLLWVILLAALWYALGPALLGLAKHGSIWRRLPILGVELAWAAQSEVTMGPTNFNPILIEIRTGDTVLFNNTSSTAHTAETDGQGTNFNSGNLDAGQKYTTPVFRKPGTIDYYCQYHRSAGMIGQIRVTGEPLPDPEPTTSTPSPTPEPQVSPSPNPSAKSPTPAPSPTPTPPAASPTEESTPGSIPLEPSPLAQESNGDSGINPAILIPAIALLMAVAAGTGLWFLNRSKLR